MNIAILTDFINFDESYSLCRVVADQCKILSRNGLMPRLIVRDGFNHHGSYETKKIVTLRNPGWLSKFLEGVDIVFTHDLIFQEGMIELCEMAYQVAIEKPELKWLHWVHSNGFRETKHFPNSRIVAFHNEEVERKKRWGYKTVVIPNPFDVMAYYDPLACQIIRQNELWTKDAIAVYPCRLDRGKQPHIVCEIFEHLPNSKVIIADFHSTAGDKVIYRDEIKERFDGLVFFTSDISPYQILHKAVMNLFEYADVLIQPSQSETDSLIVHEAMWQRCGLVLNMDLPRFREFGAITGHFSSFEVSGKQSSPGHIARHIEYLLGVNPILSQHIKVRKQRSIEALWPTYQEIINTL